MVGHRLFKKLPKLLDFALRPEHSLRCPALRSTLRDFLGDELDDIVNGIRFHDQAGLMPANILLDAFIEEAGG